MADPILARTDGVGIARLDGVGLTTKCKEECCGEPIGTCDCDNSATAPDVLNDSSENNQCGDAHPIIVQFEEHCCGTKFWAVAMAAAEGSAVLQANHPTFGAFTLNSSVSVVLTSEPIVIDPVQLAQGKIPVSLTVTGQADAVRVTENGLFFKVLPAEFTNGLQTLDTICDIQCPRPFTILKGSPAIADLNLVSDFGNREVSHFVAGLWRWKQDAQFEEITQLQNDLGLSVSHPGIGWFCKAQNEDVDEGSQTNSFIQGPGTIETSLTRNRTRTQPNDFWQFVDAMSCQVTSALITVPFEYCEGETGLPPPAFPAKAPGSIVEAKAQIDQVRRYAARLVARHNKRIRRIAVIDPRVDEIIRKQMGGCGGCGG